MTTGAMFIDPRCRLDRSAVNENASHAECDRRSR